MDIASFGTDSSFQLLRPASWIGHNMHHSTKSLGSIDRVWFMCIYMRVLYCMVMGVPLLQYALAIKVNNKARLVTNTWYPGTGTGKT